MHKSELIFALINNYRNKKQMTEKHIPKIMKIYRIVKYIIIDRHFYGLSSLFRVLPDFVIIGSKRCGTTSLYHYLAQHPSIIKSSHDHLGFFDDNFDLGLNYYKSFFPTKLKRFFVKRKFKKFLTYDVTSTYISSETTAKNIYNTLPHVKIIAILREPVSRAYSEYNETLKTNNKIEEFTKVLGDFANPTGILNKSCYYRQLKFYFQLFSRENILILSTEELNDNPQKVFDQIFEFLNVEKFRINTVKRFSENKYTNLDSKTKNELSRLFYEENQKLFELIGKKFSW